MGKRHRDNYKARKKRGPVAFEKKAKRRRGHYIGPWNVIFHCGKRDYQPMARSNEVADVAIKAHRCEHQGCRPTKFERLA